MAKTVYLNSYAGLGFGYEVNTTVVSAEKLVIPGDPEAEPRLVVAEVHGRDALTFFGCGTGDDVGPLAKSKSWSF